MVTTTNEAHNWGRLRFLLEFDRVMAATALPGFLIFSVFELYELWLVWVVGGGVSYWLNRKLKCPYGGKMASNNIHFLFDRNLKCNACGARRPHENVARSLEMGSDRD